MLNEKKTNDTSTNAIANSGNILAKIDTGNNRSTPLDAWAGTVGVAPDCRKKIADLMARTQAALMMWSVTLLIMLEDDAAMLAFMFC